mmetsp:Transcript_33297/g.71938  ORF Transcript_33297/g.71938 Transcript_33297/m.71938 type:complete len:241 (-) Transcript_33297:1515-2237(-)
MRDTMVELILSNASCTQGSLWMIPGCRCCCCCVAVGTTSLPKKASKLCNNADRGATCRSNLHVSTNQWLALQCEIMCLVMLDLPLPECPDRNTASHEKPSLLFAVASFAFVAEKGGVVGAESMTTSSSNEWVLPPISSAEEERALVPPSSNGGELIPPLISAAVARSSAIVVVVIAGSSPLDETCPSILDAASIRTSISPSLPYSSFASITNRPVFSNATLGSVSSFKNLSGCNFICIKS